MTTPAAKFHRGDRVIKVTGEYHPPGIVLYPVLKMDGRTYLYAVEHPWGIVHLYREKDLNHSEPTGIEIDGTCW